MDSSITPFFQPKGIAVVGASTSPEKLGYGVARNLLQSGYRGEVHFVSQKKGELFGHPLYTDVSQLPDPVDLAILIVPPDATPKTIEDCGKRGIKAAIIMSAGFREVGAEGAALEQQCVEIAHAHGVRLLGPNCIGTIDTHLPLDTTFLQPPMPAQGHIGFISHSGAFCAAIIDWSRGEGFGFSQLISLGNQADVNETDALAALAENEQTRVIVLYMESVSDGRRFVDVAREVTRRKPVIALKVGRFEAGQKAAASHTGALAASDTAFDAGFEKAGILRANSAEQLFDWARGLENCPLPKGKRIGVLTNAGGPGVIAADALEDNGLQLAHLSESTCEALSSTLPPAANIHNPVDMLASASPETYATCLKILLNDDNVDGALVILPPPPMFKAEDVAEKLVSVIPQFDKPVVVALLGSTLIQEARSRLERSNASTPFVPRARRCETAGSGQAVPTFPFPERAASALGALVKRAEFLDHRPSTIDHSMVHRPSSMVIHSLEELLEEHGISISRIKLAQNLHEAESIANELGYPVVMKIASPDILHKSDVGGVVLNIQNDAALLNAYAKIMNTVRVAKPEARIEGVHIQQQIPSGQEVIVGAVRDPQFGPLMMFGSGGVEVEGLKDVSFALAPLSQAEALKMIRKTWAGRKLQGFRNIPPADEDSVIDVLIKLSHLVLENESIEEIEINPLRVIDKGAVAIDVRMKAVVLP
jgi:acetyl coenzyme A synthetase (ADP forming)-like protein